MHLSIDRHYQLADVEILARILGSEDRRLPKNMARFILKRQFSEEDKGRMHELAERNQFDDLSVAEKDELIAYARAGTLLAILKSKARRSLRISPKQRAKAT